MKNVASSSQRNYELLADAAHKMFLAFIIELLAPIAVVLDILISGGVATLISAHLNVLLGSVGFLSALLLTLLLFISSFMLTYLSFKQLNEYDRPKYWVGVTGIKMLIGGLILVALAVVVMIGTGAYGAISTVSSVISSPVMAFKLLRTSLIILGVVLGIAIFGGLLALVGGILVLVCLWRLGDEPGGGLLKVHVILVIITPILALIGFHVLAAFIAFISIVVAIVGAKSISENALREQMLARK